MGYIDFTEKAQPKIVESFIESDRFGFRIARATSCEWISESNQFQVEMMKSDSEVIILRTKDVKPESSFGYPEFSSVSAGTLTYWSSIQNPSFPVLEPDMTYVPAKDSLDEYLSIVEDSFSRYVNHYSYNSLFSAVSTTDAYIDWAKSRALSEDKNSYSGIFRSAGKSVGVITGYRELDVIEVELGGIRRNFQGQGLYGYMVGAFWESTSPRQSTRLVISTQIENTAVQKAWSRLNMRHEFDAHTTHFVRAK
jgi:hypothetical protein